MKDKHLPDGPELMFEDIIEDQPSAENYYFSSQGVIIRVLRADDLCAGMRPAHLQIFNMSGKLIREATKVKESSMSFFRRNFSDALHNTTCIPLSSKPSFIPNSNVKSFHDIVPRSRFSIFGTVLNKNFG